MKKFVLILAVIAIALAQGSCSGKAAQEETEAAEQDTCVIDTLSEVPVVDLDSICND